MSKKYKLIVLITGSTGNVGTAFCKVPKHDYRVVSCDRPGTDYNIGMSITSGASVQMTLQQFRKQHGE